MDEWTFDRIMHFIGENIPWVTYAQGGEYCFFCERDYPYVIPEPDEAAKHAPDCLYMAAIRYQVEQLKRIG